MAALHDVELRHLRAFVALAEERHFGRAARRRFVSQPALSQTIAQLEDRLGCALVDRADRRRVALTAAGESLLAHARELDALVEAALRDVAAGGRAAASQLRVGYNDGEPLAQRPAALRDAVGGAGLTVSFRRLPWGREAEALRRREVDALLARLPLDGAGLSVLVVHREPLRLVVSRRHALARRRRVARAELARLPMVRPLGGSPAWRAFWRGVADGAGVDGPEVSSPEETFDVVAAGRAACLVPASMLRGPHAGAVRSLAVDGLPPSELAVVWRGAPRPPIDAFIEAVRGLLGPRPPARRPARGPASVTAPGGTPDADRRGDPKPRNRR